MEKAEALEKTGNLTETFHVLQEIATNKRNRSFSKSIETIMLKFMDLCVEFRKPRTAKDGLLQFKNLCSPPGREVWAQWRAGATAPNASSLFTVVHTFLNTAEARVKEAQEKSDQIHLDLVEVVDEEAGQQVESSIVNAIHGQDLKNRTEREHFIPWLIFLRDSYRACIDVLRNNPYLEEGYHSVVGRAFEFCKQYKQRTEFRRLCDTTRTHLATTLRFAREYLKETSVFEYYMDTRLKQLQTATELELWQEAYRTVEDVYSLMDSYPRQPSNKLLLRYLELLSVIFWHSHNHLFHAYSLSRFFVLLQIEERKVDKSRLQEISSKVLLSVLCVPDEKRVDDYSIDMERNNHLKLAALMKAVVPPVRSDLIYEVKARKVTHSVYPELSQLYDIMETEVNPMSVPKRMKPVFEFLEKHDSLSVYVPQLRKVVLFRVLQLMSRVYEVVKLSDLYKMFPHFTPVEIERRVIQAVSGNMLYVTIDHVAGALYFGNPNMFESLLRDELSRVAKGINSTVKLIKPQFEEEQRQYKKQFFNTVIDFIEKENEELRSRKNIISTRQKEKETWVAQQKERAEAIDAKREEREANKQQSELEKEKERIEAQQRQKEKQRQHIADLVEILDELAKTEGVDVKKMKNKISGNVAFALSVNKENMVQQLLEEKQKKQQRREKEVLDKLIRAHAYFQVVRDRESQRVDKVYKTENKDQKAHHEKVVKEAKAKREMLLKAVTEQKARYSKIGFETEQLKETILEQRRAKFEEEKAAYEQRKAEALAKWEAEKEEWEKKREAEAAAYRPIRRESPAPTPEVSSSDAWRPKRETTTAWRPSRRTESPRAEEPTRNAWRPSRRSEEPPSRSEEPRRGGAWRPRGRTPVEPPTEQAPPAEKSGAWKPRSRREGSRWQPPHKRA